MHIDSLGALSNEVMLHENDTCPLDCLAHYKFDPQTVRLILV